MTTDDELVSFFRSEAGAAMGRHGDSMGWTPQQTAKHFGVTMLACGGCGQDDPARRCIGCFHEFTPSAPAAEGVRKDGSDWLDYAITPAEHERRKAHFAAIEATPPQAGQLPWLGLLGSLVSAALNRDLSADEHRAQVNAAHSALFDALATRADAPRGEIVGWQYREIRHPNGSLLPANEVGQWQHADDVRQAEIRALPPAGCRFELRPVYPAPPLAGQREDT